MKYRIIAISAIAVASITGISAQDEPYRNPALSADERAMDLLHRMTLDEKISQMVNNAPGIGRLGIERYDWWNEALHGVGRAGLATVFPQAIGMAATFDDGAVYTSFDMVSDEARAKHHEALRHGDRSGYKGLTFWTPNINIFRDPRWGRGQETYGEDPWLTSRMGLAVIRGLQGDGTGKYDKTHACAKHYAVHSGPEWNRHSFNANNISPRDLYETYLPAFKTAVTEGNVKEVMCAYNRFEDEPCCSSKKLLSRILRDDWGYDNIVVSDCGAIADFYTPNHHETHTDAPTASADAVLTGTDLECGGSYHSLKEAVVKGLIPEEKIDESVFRLLRARFQLGMFDDESLVEWSSIPYSVVNSPEHQAQALKMARESMVLLSNRGNILPLSKDLGKIAVLGPNAADSIMMWGNYCGLPAHTVTILEGIRNALPAAEVVYLKGCDFVDNQVMYSYFDQCSIDGVRGFKAEYWNNPDMSGTPDATAVYAEPINLTTLGGIHFVPGINIENFTGRFISEFKPEKSGEVTFYLSADDGMRLYIDGKCVIDDWEDGASRQNTYTMDVEAGKVYPLTIGYRQGGGDGEIRFDLGYRQEIDYAAVASRVADADAIIFAGGISPQLEGEEMGVRLPGFRQGDRTDIELPEVQKEMIKALAATGKPLVFVVCTGSALALTEENELAGAILNAWYPGQAGGTAVADVLFGDYNPAGRLPVTFYASSADLPDFEDYDMDERTYRYFRGTPLFPFGHGLSYTDFAYGNGKLDSPKLKIGETGRLTIPVTNTGRRDGEEVVQVYIRNLQDEYGPVRSLRSFRRVPVKSGETADVTFDLFGETFEFYDPGTERMAILPGEYEIFYGGTSDPAGLKSMRIELTE